MLNSARNWKKASEFLDRLTDEEKTLLAISWEYIARTEQLPPDGDWTTWIFLGGRGAGKTRAGAEWVRARAERGLAKRIALVAGSANDGRFVMIEGDSGLLSVCPDDYKPNYEPSKRLLVWPDGVIATLYSAEEPDALRGPQHDTAWCDELAKWNHLEATWDNLQLGLRLGAHPQQMITTTPRPLQVLKNIMKQADSVTTKSTSYDNREHLPKSFFANTISKYEGTRFGRQEVEAEFIEDAEGALWTRAMMDEARWPADEAEPQMARTVIGVDPSGTGGEDSRNEVGIVVAGRGVDGRGYIIADWTCALSPAGWSRRVAEAAAKHKADCIVAETNFGGEMVVSLLKTADVNTRVKTVTASHGKIARAEPICALYEQKRIRHLGAFRDLENQLCAMTTDGYIGKGSPDRADAAIWALSELMLKKQNESGWLDIVQEFLDAKKDK